MLQLGKVRAGEYHIDLGSGDGRIAVTSAAKHGARSFGVDLNPVRIEEARANAKKAGVSDRATFELKNLFETDIGKADVVTMYLLPSVNIELRPKVLRDMWPGTRIVSHAFDMGDWQPDHRESVIGRTVYLWIVPARVEGRWTIEGSHKFTVTIQQKYQEITGTADIGGKNRPAARCVAQRRRDRLLHRHQRNAVSFPRHRERRPDRWPAQRVAGGAGQIARWSTSQSGHWRVAHGPTIGVCHARP